MLCGLVRFIWKLEGMRFLNVFRIFVDLGFIWVRRFRFRDFLGWKEVLRFLNLIFNLMFFFKCSFLVLFVCF